MLAERTVNFTGYIEPVGGIEVVTTATTMAPLLITTIIIIVATIITIHRLDLVKALSDL
jgi:hypothetical protein